MYVFVMLLSFDELTNIALEKKKFIFPSRDGGTNSLLEEKCLRFYQPIMRRRKTSNVFWSTGLVNMSAQLRAEATFVILHAPDRT
jgi:hypothetical protein